MLIDIILVMYDIGLYGFPLSFKLRSLDRHHLKQDPGHDGFLTAGHVDDTKTLNRKLIDTITYNGKFTL